MHTDLYFKLLAQIPKQFLSVYERIQRLGFSGEDEYCSIEVNHYSIDDWISVESFLDSCIALTEDAEELSE
jgi:hypothetical protein